MKMNLSSLKIERLIADESVDAQTKKAIKDMRFDLARLELKLHNTKQGDYYRTPDGTKFDKRSVIEDQILEVRQRLKEMLEWEKDYEVPSGNAETDSQEM